MAASTKRDFSSSAQARRPTALGRQDGRAGAVEAVEASGLMVGWHFNSSKRPARIVLTPAK